jgi:hypothetical protein
MSSGDVMGSHVSMIATSCSNETASVRCGRRLVGILVIARFVLVEFAEPKVAT